MITSEQIDALDADERTALMRRLAALQLPRAGRDAADRRFGRAVRAVVTVGALVLVPWTVYLAASLPRRTMTNHWRAAWVGFDLLLAFALAATAWFAWHRLQLVVVGLGASAVLLVCDAWFDVMLTRGPERWTSLAMAVLVELPVAAMFVRGIVQLHRLNADIVWSLTGHPDRRPSLLRFPLVSLLLHDDTTGGPA